jgi:hypothetical protein
MKDMRSCVDHLRHCARNSIAALQTRAAFMRKKGEIWTRSPILKPRVDRSC